MCVPHYESMVLYIFVSIRWVAEIPITGSDVVYVHKNVITRLRNVVWHIRHGTVSLRLLHKNNYAAIVLIALCEAFRWRVFHSHWTTIVRYQHT